MFEKLKKVWVEKLWEERHGIGEWIIYTYRPMLCLYKDGNVLFASYLIYQSVGEYVVGIELESFQEEVRDLFRCKWKDMGIDIDNEDVNIDSPEMEEVKKEIDGYIIERIIEFVQKIEESDEYPVYLVM